jgi:hypothetical protein
VSNQMAKDDLAEVLEREVEGCMSENWGKLLDLLKVDQIVRQVSGAASSSRALNLRIELHPAQVDLEFPVTVWVSVNDGRRAMHAVLSIGDDLFPIRVA